MHRFYGEDGVGNERRQYANDQIEQNLNDDEWEHWEEFNEDRNIWFRSGGDGFCAGSLAVARLMIALAGPNADDLMTQQRMKRTMKKFPFCPSSDLGSDFSLGREDAVVERNFSVDFIHAATRCPSKLPPLGVEPPQQMQQAHLQSFRRSDEQQTGLI